MNSVGQYTASHKAWDHVGNIINSVEVQEMFRSGDLKPACWLPVQFWDKAFEDWIVVTPGKIVALDNDGRVVPAQYGLGSATMTYTTDDVTSGTIDVRTGVALLAAATGTFNVSAVTDFMGRGIEALSVSMPIGVASYCYLQWSGDGSENDDGWTPAGFKRHNYNCQHSVAATFDYGIQLPLVPAATSTENMTRNSHVGQIQTFTALANLPVAKNTMRTTITFADGTLTDSATRFLNEVPNAVDVLNPGDWHIVLETGVITVWADAPLAAGNVYTVSYSNYASAPTGSNVSKFACALGDLVPGDFVKCNADSNFVKATPKVYGTSNGDNFDTFSAIMGQVVVVEVYPKDYLERVRTAYTSLGTSATGSYPGYAGQMDQMPGSATGGVPSNLHYAGAADKVVIVNLISR